MAEPASGEESKSDSDPMPDEDRTCRICYSAEFQDGMGAFSRSDAVQLRGQSERRARACLRRWQTIARRNRHVGGGATCVMLPPRHVNLGRSGGEAARRHFRWDGVGG